MVSLKIICLCAVLSVCKATILDDVFEKEVERRATACVVRRACRGLLWRGYLLAQYSCLEHRAPADVVIEMGLANCSIKHVVEATSPYSTMGMCRRYVTEVHKHPLYPEVDLALLQLEHPYESNMSYHTSNNAFFLKVDIWIKNIEYTNLIERRKIFEEYSRKPSLKMYSTPVRMFLFTVVLPSVSFIVFFVYVIFFTGTNRTIKIPSDSIPYESLNSGRKKQCV